MDVFSSTGFESRSAQVFFPPSFLDGNDEFLLICLSRTCIILFLFCHDDQRGSVGPNSSSLTRGGRGISTWQEPFSHTCKNSKTIQKIIFKKNNPGLGGQFCPGSLGMCNSEERIPHHAALGSSSGGSRHPVFV